ncbi:glycerate kinase [Hyphomicrobium sp. CS1BSMeth3]|uniref:glycerate kinase family protein n=1 Tax=Hyphomicrobium sp. CS1BSMeth3 TaxID=1892844 RepID=UPI0009306C81|nr:glycerate kinase [Hyphomicrobium sp. CS1BSMeth3]
MCITVLIAPSGLKECLSAHEAAAAMAIGVRRAWRDARIFEAPIADGGEGFTAALVRATNGTLHAVEVTGPTGAPVQAHIGFLGVGRARTAVVDIASAAGLALIPEGQRNPSETTSFGVGELIRAALDRRADRIIVGCGDSGVNDGGAGMAQALGAHLLDRNGRTIDRGGAALAGLAGIDLRGIDARLAKVRIDAAVNPHNALLGARGVTRIYGPQKGARPDQIDVLERAMANFAQRLREATGVDVANLAGAGASGGIGAALAAICGAVLHPRYDIVMRYTCFDRRLPEADLVLTAEGSLDGQTPFGKIPAEVGRRAAAYGIPVIAFAGRIGEGAEANLDHGISAYRSINTRPMPLAEAMANAERLLASSVEYTLRSIGGRILRSRIPSEPCAEPVLRRA